MERFFWIVVLCVYFIRFIISYMSSLCECDAFFLCTCVVIPYWFQSTVNKIEFICLIALVAFTLFGFFPTKYLKNAKG